MQGLHEIVHPSGSSGIPSAPMSSPGGSGPMISAGGDPWLCIWDERDGHYYV